MLFYRRKLPHWQPETAPGNFLFVTWRLAGSLPRTYVGQALSPAGIPIMVRPAHVGQVFPPAKNQVVRQGPRVGQALSPAKNAGRTFVTIDQQLDRATSGPLWLKDTRVAAVVKNALCHGERERLFYKLAAWVIMPNHVHVLLEPKAPLPKVLRWLKGSTAHKANRILNRTGTPFRQDESFDHWVRNDREFNRIVRYIEHNPVTAGLVESPADWPWSSAQMAGESACPTRQPTSFPN